MKRRTCFLTREQSMILRGAGVILVMVTHFINWYADLFNCEPLRYALMRSGIYGVDLFFLASGYGLVKSASGKKIRGIFLWKRFKNTYLPYLLIVGCIELTSGGIHGAKDWYQFFTGYDYWFIRNILVFYLAFFLVFRSMKTPGSRITALAACTIAYTAWLIAEKRADFWYVSNVAFWLGAAIAQYEKKLLKIANFLYPAWIDALALGVGWVVKSGMDGRLIPPMGWEKIRDGIAASAIWTLFAAQAACLLRGRLLCFLIFLGEISLEMYLLHLFLFYRVLNGFPELGIVAVGALSIGLTAVLSWLIHWLFSLLFSAAEALGKKSGKKGR